MSTYTAPLSDMRFVIDELAGLGELAAMPVFEEATPDVVDAVLAEAARLAGEVLAPLNRTGDLQGARLEDGSVVTTPGFAEAYHRFVDGGWMGLGLATEHGGQGMPFLVAMAVNEMWQSANMAFSLCPMLTMGTMDALLAHGTPALQRLYLPRLATGEWCGTMNLTEAQAGSDLAALRTRAEPDGSHYRISGQKIFITWGDHDMAENVVHMVLARLPDAPPGVKGISMFLVPKFLVDDDGMLGERNDLHAVSLEHKLGIHASPTCVMSYGEHEGAIGYLMGEPNEGLACMFTMMNHARLDVGLQGVAIAERAYQQAATYARERVQGHLPGRQGRVTIIHHADVRRMLMLMRAEIRAMRAVAYCAGATLDRAHHAREERARRDHQARVDLLTPVVKGWCTELAQEVTSMAVQVHGGAGYIEETGCAQHLRDGRITTIYEGTTGIQANDFAGRKILRDGGAAMKALLEDLQGFATALDEGGEDLGRIPGRFREGVEMLAGATGWLLEHGPREHHVAGSAAVNLLMLAGTVLGGWQMARTALAAADGTAARAAEKRHTARFYFDHVMPRASAYYAAATAGCEDLLAVPEEAF